jgi:broad specificity phosphatase PhoE
MADNRVFKWPALLVVMRHAQSEANLHRETLEAQESPQTHVHLGSRDVDVPLTEEGRRQARETGHWLAEQQAPFDAIYVSPYRRTRDTGEVVAAQLDPAPTRIIEERVREKEFGILEGLTRRGVNQLHPGEVERRRRVGKYYYRPPGGESYPDVNLRVHSFLGTLVREHAGQRVLVVTHSVVVLSFRRLLERLDEGKVLDLDRHDEPRNASLSIYESFPAEGTGSGLLLREWNMTPWAPETGRLASV